MGGVTLSLFFSVSWSILSSVSSNISALKGLLRRLYKGDFTPEEKAALTGDIKLSINGISAGLKNTG